MDARLKGLIFDDLDSLSEPGFQSHCILTSRISQSGARLLNLQCIIVDHQGLYRKRAKNWGSFLKIFCYQVGKFF